MKNFIILFVAFFLTISKANSEIIKDIKVNGNKRITDDTVILFSKVKINQDINPKELNDIIKRLYSTNFFSNINVSIDNNIVTINVVENPVIETVEFLGVKNKKLLEILNEKIRLKEKNSFLKSIVKNDEILIINILRANGFYFSEVKSKIRENENNTVNLIYDINLGDKAYIKKIKFIGDKKIKDRKLRSIIVSEEDKFWKFISRKKFLDLNRIKFDEKLLKNYYKNNGYFDVQVESSSAKIINESDFELVFNINAGNKYYFNKLELNIPDDYSINNFKSITDLFNDLKGQVYSFSKIEDILKEIDKIALSKEYEFVNAKYVETTSGSDKINLKIELEETEKFYIEQINVYGNYITDEKVIRNSLIIDEGDPYNKILLNKSVNEIKAKKIFEKVETKISEGSDSKKKIIDLNVEEKPTGEISAGAGTGTSGSVLSFAIKENNYLGEGIKLNTNVTLSDTSLKGILSFRNPNFKNTDRSLNTTIETTTTDEMTKHGYETSKTGFSFGTNFEQYRNVYFSPTISTYFESLDTSVNASASKKKQEGEYFETLFRYGLSLNKLNQNWQPSDGYKSTFRQTFPIYSSDDFTLENAYEFKKYYSIKDDMIFSFIFYSKAVNSLSDEDVRVTKRVFIPSRKLRGFEQGKIGPLDGGEFIGGNYGSAMTVNTTLPQLFSELENVDFSLFFDAANVWGVDYDSSLDSDKIRSSTGLAVDWFTPIGPLSLSFSQPISKASTDITEKFRFNIGTTF